jgi:L-aminopeptidase/D-esterase-like protein
MDGKDILKWWYGIDWSQINSDITVANAVINGSNNPANPLYLNQDGINRLQGVGAQTLSNLITYGLAAGTVVQTALDPVALQTAINNGSGNKDRIRSILDTCQQELKVLQGN